MLSSRARIFLLLLLGSAFLLFAGALSSTGAAAGGPAVVITLTPVADTYVDEEQPDANFGAQALLVVRNELPGSSSIRSYALLKFDLSALPANADVQQAGLHLTLGVATGDNTAAISVTRARAPWSENGVTWNTRPPVDAPFSTVNVGMTTPAEYIWDVTGLVIDWKTGIFDNDGFVLIMDEAADALRAFRAKDGVRQIPYLEITYTLPTGGGSQTPTPTPTPVSTSTPTPTPTPPPTSIPPTSTPTPTATATPSPTSTPSSSCPPATPFAGHTWTVDRVADDFSALSLRCALLLAQDGDFIRFDPAVFPPDAPAVIHLNDELPPITQSNLFIDGRGAGVIIDGAHLASDSAIAGLTLTVSSSDTHIVGLTIRNMPGAGIVVMGAANVIGLVPDVTASSQTSVAIAGPPDTPANVIIDNGAAGIIVYGNNTTLRGNYIGVEAGGQTPAPNGGSGILVQNAAGVQIGGAKRNQGNLISGNSGAGVWIKGTGTANVQVQGNYIGVNREGVHALPNERGIVLENLMQSITIGGNKNGEGNLISGNQNEGVLIEGGKGAWIAGNFIGMNIAGEAALANGGDGVSILSGRQHTIGGIVTEAFHCAPPCNLISGNLGAGIRILKENSHSNSVKGNFIGTRLGGGRATGNQDGGVVIAENAHDNTIGGTLQEEGNLISGNIGPGIHLQNALNNHILGNRIGASSDGMHALANQASGVWLENSPYNFIAGVISNGHCVSGCNLVSGNKGAGIAVTGNLSEGNIISGNFIGVQRDGMAALANGQDGILIANQARNTQVQANLISGNQEAGVRITGLNTQGNEVRGNTIGLDIDQQGNVGNEVGLKIDADAKGNKIGVGDFVTNSNVIAGNRSFGVVIDGAQNNTVAHNAIYGNGAGRAADGSGILITRGAHDNIIGDSPIAGNYIYSNAQYGIEIKGAHDNIIVGNRIGIQPGNQPAGNGDDGVYIYGEAHDNLIIGKLYSSKIPNWIAYNQGNGVTVKENSLRNTIIYNSINGNEGKGIATVQGGNQELPPPQPTQVNKNNNEWTIQGKTCANCAVHVYSDFGDEGRFFETQTVAAADGSFAVTVSNPVASYLTLTATDGDGNTSEFTGLEDIEVTGIEVTQAVQSQNPDNIVPLIAHKRTFVRVHVRSTYQAVANIDARLIVDNGTDGTNFTPTGDPCEATITVLTQPRRDKLDESFCFELPDEWTAAGGLYIEASVNTNKTILESNYDNNTLATSVSFQEAPPLKLQPVLVTYVEGTPPISTITLPVTITFEAGDKIAAGDLTGDSIAEIAIAHAMTGTIDILDSNYQLLTTIDAGFEEGDGLLIADAYTDTVPGPAPQLLKVDELLVAHTSSHLLEIWDWKGGLMTKVSANGYDVDFHPGNEMAYGDVMPQYAGPELVIGGDNTKKIDVFQGAFGDDPWSYIDTYDMHEVEFNANDKLAIGDVIGGNNVSEIIIAGDKSGTIDIVSWHDNDFWPSGQFQSSFDTGGLFLVGDIDDAGPDDVSPDEIVTGNADCHCFQIYDWDAASQQWKEVYLMFGFLQKGSVLGENIWQDNSSAAMADFNGDGRLDIIVAHTDNTMEVYSKQTSGPWKTVSPTTDDANKIISMLQRALPVPGVKAKPPVDISLVTATPLSPHGWLVLSLLRRLKLGIYGKPILGNFPPIPDPNPDTFYYGILSSQGGAGGGLAQPSWGVAAGASGWAGPKTAVHELGHLLGRKHVKSGCGGEPNPDPNYPYPQGLIGGPASAPNRFLGFDVGDDAFMEPTKPYSGTGTADIMTYCGPRWVSDYTYKGMLQALPTPTVSALAQTQSGPVIGFVATMQTDGSRGSIETMFVAAQGQPSALPADSPVRLRLEDAGGQTLALYPLHAETAEAMPGGASSAWLLSDIVPFPEQTHVIRFEYQGSEVMSRTVSAHPPTVTLLSPNGGEHLHGQVTLQWHGSDVDGDALLYDVLYSYDGGQSWMPVAVDWPRQSFTLDLSRLPGSDHVRFRVAANDGVLTAMDDSDADSIVPAQAPLAFIEAPRRGAFFLPEQNVLLRGRGQDLETPSLPDGAFVWESDISGVLGSGRSLLLSSLPRGKHHITLTVTDEQGMTGRASTTIYVGVSHPVSYMPLVLHQ